MDFKGTKGWDHPVGPLSVLDDHSRYLPALEDTGNTCEEGVRETLHQTFLECGVPEQMLMHHGCTWWNGQGARCWTRFRVWLRKQASRVRSRGDSNRKTKHKVEATHLPLAGYI